ncbi:MAG: hypothetical protein H6867_01995 [Rhodospirillales bacterium]|nr:hypothetical protein [Rhodospirillales bacterium]MCB9996959.1 hypothetical protein [Rhodospirillales bacterium]
MSGDKDLEDQIPGESSAVEDEFSDTDMAGDEYADEAYGSEEDFAEGDWEAYDDEESYLDDGEGDGGLAARRAAFNKFLVGGAILVAMGGGFFVYKSNNQPENMGEPVMAQTGEVAAVLPDEKVEFHSDIKPPPAFGVTYGDEVEEENANEKIEERREGILNDPGAMARLRGREQIADAEYVVRDDSGGYHHGLQQDDNGQQPPMPSPIGAADKGDMFKNRDRVESDPGLIPMPESAVKSDAANISSGGNDHARSDLRVSGDAMEDTASVQKNTVSRLDDGDIRAGQENEPDNGLEFAMDDGEDIFPERRTMAGHQHEDVPGSARSETIGNTDMAALSEIRQSLGQISDRLDRMEDNFRSLNKRIDGVEKTAAKAASAPAPRRDVQVQPTRPSKNTQAKMESVPVAKSSEKPWVLKSAQPGSAMVARQGDAETYTIAVGDSFADIGRITSIAVEGGRWVVSGTAGKIMQ